MPISASDVPVSVKNRNYTYSPNFVLSELQYHFVVESLRRYIFTYNFIYNQSQHLSLLRTAQLQINRNNAEEEQGFLSCPKDCFYAKKPLYGKMQTSRQTEHAVHG